MEETSECELISGRWWVCRSFLCGKTRGCHNVSHALRKAIARQLYRGLFVDQEKLKRVFSSYLLLPDTQADKAITQNIYRCKTVDFDNEPDDIEICDIAPSINTSQKYRYANFLGSVEI